MAKTTAFPQARGHEESTVPLPKDAVELESAMDVLGNPLEVDIEAELDAAEAKLETVLPSTWPDGYDQDSELRTKPVLSPDSPKESDGSGALHWDPKWGREAPKEWVPFLQSFILFPDLPLEIRQAIWKFSLKPRVIDLHFSATHGFYSQNKTPVAMRVSRESRTAVQYLYPICFGNIFHRPAITFNFLLDTLYFDDTIGPDVIHFLLSMKEPELRQIRYIAADHSINEWIEYYEGADVDNIGLFKKAVKSMPSLKEFHFVYKLDDWWHGHGFPAGEGPIELYEEFPYKVQAFMFNDGFHLDDEDGASECQELPHSDRLLEGFNVPKMGSIWGWRPCELDMTTPQWAPSF